MRPTAIAIHRLAVQNTKRYFSSQKALQNPPPTVPPLPHTIVCIGRNYANHISELGNTRPAEPFFFLKPVGSLLKPQKKNTKDLRSKEEVLMPISRKVLMPKGCDLHYEVELAVVLKSKVDEWNGDMEGLKDIVWGYNVAIDMTARNYQTSAKEKGLPWSLSKGLKTFLPISNFIPFNVIPDPHNVQLHLEVNGQTRQEDSTNLMLFNIPMLLRHVTSVMPLFTGDLLLTGTPKGVGKVIPGDKITAGVRVNGKEIELGKISVDIADRVSGYGSKNDKKAIEKVGGNGAAEKKAPQGS